MTHYSNRSRYNPRVFDAIASSLRDLAPLTAAAQIRRIAGKYAKRHTDWQGAVSSFAKEYAFLFVI